MATRVNTKFVFLLAGVIVLIVGMFGAVWYLKVARSPEQLEREGDAFLAQDQPRLAIEKYGAAIQSGGGGSQIIHKYIETLEPLPAADRVEARRFLGSLIDMRRRAAELDPSDPEPRDAYYGYLLHLAENLTPSFYNNLYDQTSTHLAQYPDDPVARRYRGIAQANRVNSQMTRPDQLQAYKDLMAAYEADPRDAQVARHLAKWSLWEADRLEDSGGEAAEIQALRDTALEISRKMYEADPEDLNRRLYHVQTLLSPGIDQQDAAAPILAQVEANLLENPSPRWAVLETADLLPRLDAENGAARAEAIVRAAAEQKPDSVIYHAALGRLLMMQDERQAAAEQFEKAWGIGTVAPAVESMRAQEVRLTAGMFAADALIREAAGAEADRRDDLLAQASQRIEEVKAAANGEAAMLHLLEGKIALAKGQDVAASRHLSQAVEAYQGRNPEALLLAGQAYARIDAPGQAIASFRKVVAMAPGFLPARLQLAQLHLQLQQVEQATQQIDAILQARPDNAAALLLKGQLQAARGETEQALATLGKIDLQAHPEVASQLARIYIRQGDRQKAAALLKERLEANPGDTDTLRLLYGLTEDPAERQALLQEAKQAGVSQTLLAVLSAQSDGVTQEEQEQLLDQVVNQQKDPLQRELTQMAVAASRGRTDEAKAALERAAEIAPDDRRVLDAQFEWALREENWPQARNLAARAGSLDLDAVGGAFYRGRAAAAQGRHEEAVAEFRRGLSARPIYGEGWRLMADSQVQLGDLEGADESYRRALDQQPNNVRAIRGLAALADNRGEHDHALDLIRQALRYDSDNGDLLRLYLNYAQQHGDPEEVIEMRRRLAETAPDDAQNTRALAALLADRGKIDEAVGLIQGLTERNGKTLTDAGLLAQVYAVADRPEEGERVLQDFIASRGDAAGTEDHVVLARYRLARGNMDGAIEAYNRARQSEDAQTRPATRELADQLFARGRNDQALALYQQLHREKPDDAQLALRLAEALVRTGRQDQAQSIIDRYDDHDEAHLLRATMARQAGDSQTALTELDRALRIDPSNSTALSLKAQILAQDPDSRGQARSLLEEALQTDPTQTEARLLLAGLLAQQGRAFEAIRQYETLLQQRPDSTAVRARLAELYAAEGATDEAQALVKTAAAEDPQNPLWPRLLSNIASRAGDQAAAIEHMKKAVELEPAADQVMTLATMQIEADRPQEAMQTLRAHIGLVNDQPVLQAVRGWALSAAGQPDEARQMFTKAAQRADNFVQMTLVAGYLRRAYGPSEAIALLSSIAQPGNPLGVQLVLADLEIQNRQYAVAADRLRALEPQLPADAPALRGRVLSMLGMALYQSDQHKAAADTFRELLSLRGDDVGTLNNLAYLLAENLGQADEAVKLAQRAAELAPDNAQVLDTLGWVQHLAGRNEASRRTLEESIRIQALAPNHYHLAVVLQEAGFEDQARQNLKQAINLAEKTQDSEILGKARGRLAELGAQE